MADNSGADNAGKVAVVTGGSSGVGLATSIALAAKGYSVALCGRRKELLHEAAAILEGDRHLPVVADLCSKEDAVAFANAVLERFGRIDVLVNNAGMAPLNPIDEITDQEFEATLNLNMGSIFYLTRTFWPQMKEQGGATIVNVSSLAAVDPFPGFSVYGASKAWVDLFSKALGAEGAEAGIRVCSVRPGAVETPLLRSLFPDFPAEQCVSPADVAGVILGCIEQPDQYASGEAFEVTNQPR